MMFDRPTALLWEELRTRVLVCTRATKKCRRKPFFTCIGMHPRATKNAVVSLFSHVLVCTRATKNAVVSLFSFYTIYYL